METPFNLGSTVQVLSNAIVRYRDNKKSGNCLLLLSFTHLEHTHIDPLNPTHTDMPSQRLGGLNTNYRPANHTLIAWNLHVNFCASGTLHLLVVSKRDKFNLGALIKRTTGCVLNLSIDYS